MTSVDTISYATGETYLGPVLVARSVSGVCAILIGADNDELVADLAARFPDAKLLASEAVVHDDLMKVIRFVDKPTGDSISNLTCAGRRSSAASGRRFARSRSEPRSPTANSPARLERRTLSVRSPVPAPPIRSHLPFLAIALWAAMATWRATTGASSANASSSRRRPRRERTSVRYFFCLCGYVGGGTGCGL